MPTSDLEPIRARMFGLRAQVANLSVDDLTQATRDSLDLIESMLADATDADVVFVPDDPAAHDAAAGDPSEEAIAWTLGHLVVHVTASAEEGAALGAEAARGVPFHGRSRWETPWQQVTTIEACRQRLAESRRMRLVSLQMWPDRPPAELAPGQDTPDWDQAKDTFLRGLQHEASHYQQFNDVLNQAMAARPEA